MSERTILWGGVQLSQSAFEKAQDTELLEMSFMASDDPDEIECLLKGVKAKDLFASGGDHYRQWAQNDYDPKSQLWVFGVSLHDDDLPNANTAELPKRLSALKDHPGTDFVFACHGLGGYLERAWRVDSDGGGEIDELPDLPKPLSRLIVEGKYTDALRAASALFSSAGIK